MLRAISENDASDLAELMRELSPFPSEVTEETTAQIRRKIQEISQLGHMRVYGYEKDGRLVGTCTLGRVEGLSKGCRPFAVIENVVVLESMRSQGIGEQLVCHAIDQAEKWGCYKVSLETGSKQEWKLQFYEKCGLTRGDKTAFIKRF